MSSASLVCVCVVILSISHYICAERMFKPLIFLSIGIIYFCGINGVDGQKLKCWHCNSVSDPFCMDPFDNSTATPKDCNTEEAPSHLKGIPATMCRKIRMKIYGHWRYKRDCARLGEPGLGGDERYCIYRSGTYNIHMEYCTCNDKENCNGATQPGRGAIGGLVVAAGATLLALAQRSWLLRLG